MAYRIIIGDRRQKATTVDISSARRHLWVNLVPGYSINIFAFVKAI